MIGQRPHAPVGQLLIDSLIDVQFTVHQYRDASGKSGVDSNMKVVLPLHSGPYTMYEWPVIQLQCSQSVSPSVSQPVSQSVSQSVSRGWQCLLVP